MVEIIHQNEKRKKRFRKFLFSYMNNLVFEKAMENIRKHRDIKLETTEK